MWISAALDGVVALSVASDLSNACVVLLFTCHTGCALSLIVLRFCNVLFTISWVYGGHHFCPCLLLGSLLGLLVSLFLLAPRLM